MQKAPIEQVQTEPQSIYWEIPAGADACCGQCQPKAEQEETAGAFTLGSSMTFPVGPILFSTAQHREHTTPRTVYGVPANSGVEQVGPAGSHEHEYDRFANGVWICWICDHTVRKPPAEATELAD